MQIRYLSTSFFDIYLEYLDSNDLVAPEIKTFVDEIKTQYPHRAPEERFLHIYHMIEEIDARPALGFRIGIGAKAQHYGVVGYMASTCATLQQALLRCMPYQSLFVNTLDARLEEHENGLVLKWWGDNKDIDRIMCEMGLTAFISFYQILIGKHIPPIMITLPFAPEADALLYEAIVGCPVKFNADCVSITLPKTILLQDISTRDPYLRSLYERQAQALLSEDVADDQFLQDTRRVIQEQLYESEASAEQVAKQLGLSLRTFYRKLSHYELRYRTLLADTRFSLARTYLADTSLSLAEVSLMLGYSDQSAFTRAFVAWSGISPSKFREEL